MVGMRVIVACSGGPDSMALLDICRKKGYEIAVAHVNYKKRETAERAVRPVLSGQPIGMRRLFVSIVKTMEFPALSMNLRGIM